MTGLTRETCVEGKAYSCRAVVDAVDGDVTISIDVSWIEGENTFSVNLIQKLTKI